MTTNKHPDEHYLTPANKQKIYEMYHKDFQNFDYPQ